MSLPGPVSNGKLNQLCINTIRTLAMDAVQKQNQVIPALKDQLKHFGFTVENIVETARGLLNGKKVR